MQIYLQAHGFALTDALDQHARRRLHFALDRFDDPVESVIVRLARDHAGRTSRCRLQVQLRRRPDILVEEVLDDLYVAIDRAAHRAAGAVARSVDRRRQLSVRGAGDAYAARAPVRTAWRDGAEDLR